MIQSLSSRQNNLSRQSDSGIVEPKPEDRSADEWGVDSIHLRLVEAAAIEFAESGLDGARVQAIAARAGLSTGAIYNRFAGRFELLLEALDVSFASVWDPAKFGASFRDGFEEVVGALPVAAPSRGDALMVETMSAARRHPEVRAAAAQWWERETKLLGESAASGVDNGTMKESLDADSVVFFSMALTVGVRVLRQAGVDAPDPDAWTALVSAVAASFES